METSQINQIREWALNPTPDFARQLIRTYRESEWRSTRLEVLKVLGRFRDSRSFQFLVEIVERNEDLAEQELAILALSQRKTRVTRNYLKKRYESAAPTLKPKLAYAAGLSHVFALSEKLKEDLETAFAKQDFTWLKNILLSLGELKVFQAAPKIKRLLEGQVQLQSDLVISIVFSLGRLERDPEFLQKFSQHFYADSLLNQVFQSAISQVQIRSQFKLEDYLVKIFELSDPHHALPLELRAFDPAEVKLGLSLFPVEKNWKRYLFALPGIDESFEVEILLQALEASGDPHSFLDVLTTSAELKNQKAAMPAMEKALGESLKDPELRLKWLDVFSELVDFQKEADFFLSGPEEHGIQFLNIWSDSAFARTDTEVKRELKAFSQKKNLSPTLLGRLYRAAVDLGISDASLTDSWTERFKIPALRSSLLYYAESFELEEGLPAISQLSEPELETLAQRVLGYLEAVSGSKKASGHANEIQKCLRTFQEHFNVDFVAGMLRVLRRLPYPVFEGFAREASAHQNPMVELNAVIALKSYRESREASLILAAKLESPSSTIQGRALDGLCNHTTLAAKRSVLEYLKQHLNSEEVVDKVYRSFDPEKKGGEEFVASLNQILKQNPDHPQWEKLVSLRDRLTSSQPQSKDAGATIELSPELQAIDERLMKVIPKFAALDATAKLALRAAEQPFLRGNEMMNFPIDKAPAVLEYCKAIDLILEKHVGQKILFPKLDHELHDFQTLWHRVGFGEDYPQADRVITLLGLKGKVSIEGFPLHKAKMMSGTFFNGKILQDRFKVFDGLRAWAVIFLIFSRKIPLSTGAIGPILKLPGITDEQCISMAKRLMSLQDLRNPAAHRQTYSDLSSIESVRAESLALINLVLA